ncbi:MAG: polyribonucleotide nucleotidyltransferase [Myxococcota bacterium]
MTSTQRGLIQLDHNSTAHHRISVPIGEVPMEFEVGRVAKQASGSAWVRWGDSVVLVTVCAGDQEREGIDFLPLTCEYIEKSYAAGRIPGGFFKREAKPKDTDILNARIIDRSIRPLFPEGFTREIQVIATVVSHDQQHSTDIMALCGASMALHVSSIPFAQQSGPIAGVRVGRVDGRLCINPTTDQRAKSDIDIVAAVSRGGLVMVEGGANQVPEKELVDALFFALQQGCQVVDACEEMRKHMGREKIVFTPAALDESLLAQTKTAATTLGLATALSTQAKLERYQALDEVKAKTVEHVCAQGGEDEQADPARGAEVAKCFAAVKKHAMRSAVLDTKARLDGRRYDEIRPICCEVGVLPKAHGSALFTRGETQALVSVTLGTRDDEQKIDGLGGEWWKRVLLHYNFPPFSVGEVKPLRGTSRREIGHGSLAERAVTPMIPADPQVFPYTTRIVSEILESNGSSSMATVCGATLAMWDAGVKLEKPVAGIAMGLIQEGERHAVLSDILGDEDHLGDMDFKVCGTSAGVTAIQMDIKIDSLSQELLTQALEQARQGRLFILEQMQKAIAGPRDQVSQHAPCILTLSINPEKIRTVIGPGGRVIRDITARTGAKVDIGDGGEVQISGPDVTSARQAKTIVQDLTREAEVGCVYHGFVKRILDFGAVVELFPGTEGLCHISELAPQRVASVRDVLQEGDEVNVMVLSVDSDGSRTKISLSRKRAEGKKAVNFFTDGATSNDQARNAEE